ncbi:proteasome regulatory non-ATPase subunit [Trypanosoma grayi]|uniref:proteasome regulatory non-ATPase subunit n=1 Tax=Trypanosoma grayi TaxID=71804 RepID=UPI0004F41CF8|nr:proteasome regulatory non-ATPase subunit [Trypanosoma grayi]KEG09667.1 proteasome regulatory non-ATPase subunit [Trypanosoma grayi]
MRNGDQFPSRFLGVQEAANLLVNAKIQTNAENTVGFLTLGGNACTVFETLTLDVDRVMTTLGKIPISGKQCHFSKGLQIASLALSHRTNPRAEKRIVAFIGSPLKETDEQLDKLARKLRKDDVAVDVVAVCVESNVPRLAAFVDKVSKQGNSRFLSVTASDNITDVLISNPIMLGNDAVAGAHDGQNDYQGFGIDPSTDPELAMAIRMSLEEEEQRRAAAATLAAQSTAPATEEKKDAAPSRQENPVDLDNMSEEDLIARALQMSLEEARKASQGAAGAGAEAATDDEQAFLRELESELERQEHSQGDSHHPNEEGPKEDKEK